ncbi:unnamed protein product [Malassezia sympodialis ATCC 42132]|uniref:uncharacterized protein n=1 Tax=Malassezia sympodialis (strain ATCC 42132) TaxID=1230383 RepID=UPI0002C1AAEF|nr:uncharacterized protein MSY001_2116 [Malassezia sympodialis ATCC 42132]CCU99410.1 unnamed protein product [Malassezia sympodialis ATCC 42132]|eukprot:XP_018740660.1 uncharacterized protein MSY001_2116 [Malassezia sympodialis ATCC 42132]
MDFTSNAAETFVTAYYAASDSPQRSQLLPSLYLPNSSVSWNGNPISGAAQYAQWLEAQPGSRHEIQSFDCHPLGPYNAHGTVAHYTPESIVTKDPSNAPKSATSTGGGSKKKFDADAPIESYPRVFSQTFVLINGAGTNTEGGVPFVWTPAKNNKNKNQTDPDLRTVAKYFIQADSLRFVG